MIQPESDRESKLLAELVDCFQMADPPQASVSADGGSGESSSCEELFEGINIQGKVFPGRLARQSGDEERIVSIDVLR